MDFGLSQRFSSAALRQHFTHRDPEKPPPGCGIAQKLCTVPECAHPPECGGAVLISQVEAAKLLGVSRRAIDRQLPDLLGLGVAVRGEGSGRIRYEAEALPTAWLELAEPQARNAEQLKKLAEKLHQEGAALAKELGEDAAPGEIPPWHESRARLEHYRAERERIAVEKLEGELVSRAEVENDWFEAGRLARDGLQRLPELIIGDISRTVGGLTQEQRGKLLILMDKSIHETLIHVSTTA